MDQLNTDIVGKRLFTYKVAHDGGSAPNPFGGICTLAICKPKIRTVALPGDLIVGLDTGKNGDRIIYVMEVSKVVSWKEYIEMCKLAAFGDASKLVDRRLKTKIPKDGRDQGDCIWTSADTFFEALPSWSNHSGEDYFFNDVKTGRNVLLGSFYWYFGDGRQFDIRLNQNLNSIIPGRGHRSNSNANYRECFIDFFNDKLVSNGIAKCGIYGNPLVSPGVTDDESRRRCKTSARQNDEFAEEP